MAFKQWFEILEHNISADNKDKSNYSYVNLSETKRHGNSKVSISPITNDLLNFWTYLLSHEKNLIVIFPENMLRPIPLLSYIYSRLISKSTLVFTSGSVNSKTHITKLHNQNYQLLRYAGSDYLYNIAPIGILNDDSLKYVPYLIHAKNHVKKDIKERIRKNLISSDMPKILLNGSDNLTKLTNVVNNVVFDKDNIKISDMKLDIGCIIFENSDRLLNSRFNMESFIEWSKSAVDNDVKFLFHFSKPNRDFLEDFKNQTNSLVLDFSNNIIHNSVISKYSRDYFSNSDNNFSILDNYNLDLCSNHFSESNVSIVDPILEKGNLDLYRYHAQRILDIIDISSLKNKRIYTLSIKLLYSLPNLSIDPSFYKVSVDISRNTWRSMPIPEVIKLLRNRLRKESKVNQILLNKLLSNINNMYYELVQCKHFFEDNNYERISKSYKILEIAYNKRDYYNNDKELIIGTYESTEVKVLNELLSDVDDVKAIHLNRLYRKSENLSDYNLLLPGIINYKYSSILENNFNQILILAYEGSNEKLIKQQIADVLSPSLYDEIISMDYYSELYDYLNLSKNNHFFNEFNKRYEESLIMQNNFDNAEKKSIEELFVVNTSYSDYVKSQEKLELEMRSLKNDFNVEMNNNLETIEITLHNLSDDKIYVKNLLKNKKYLRFEDYNKLDDLLEIPPQLLNKNDYVILIEEDKSFFDIYLSIFEEDFEVDLSFIEYWRDLLFDYIIDNDIELKQLYLNFNDFIEKEPSIEPLKYDSFKKWANDHATAPMNVEYLKALAIFLDNEYLLEHHVEMYEEADKLRIVKKNMGEKLEKLVKDIIENDESINYDLLSFEERNIYDLIKDNLYQVI